MSRASIVLLGLMACGGGKSPSQTTNSTTPPPPAVPPDAAPQTESTAVSVAECETLASHVLDVGLDEQRRTLPPERVPTPEQVEAIRVQLLVEMVPSCLAYPRQVLTCALAASTTDAIAACSVIEPSPQ